MYNNIRGSVYTQSERVYKASPPCDVSHGIHNLFVVICMFSIIWSLNFTAATTAVDDDENTFCMCVNFNVWGGGKCFSRGLIAAMRMMNCHTIVKLYSLFTFHISFLCMYEFMTT